jgi:DivIVA domain-containing protein
MWLWVVGIVLLVGVVTVIAVGSGAELSEVYEDRPDRSIPVGRALHSDDLRDVTFTTAVRGYRMDEVDALLARIRADLLAREAQAQRGDGGRPATAPVSPTGPDDPGASSPSATP